MAIEGPLRELGIHDVFQLLDLSRKTGMLRISSTLRDNEGSVTFRGGRIVGATIKSNPHPLGAVLTRAGKITEADLDRARALQDERVPRVPIGQIFVEMGTLTSRELDWYVRQQIETVIFEMMSWTEGFFSFAEIDITLEPSDAPVALSTEALLMEGARRIDEWSRIAQRVPHVGLVPALAPQRAGEYPAQLELLPNEWAVLASIDGERTLREIATLLVSNEFDVARIAYGLLTTGVIVLNERALSNGAASATASDLLAEQALDALRDGRADYALRLARQALAADPTPAARRATARALSSVGRHDEAVEEFRRAVHADPSDALLRLELGCAAARSGDLGLALTNWYHFLAAHPDGDDAVAVRTAVECAQRLHRFLQDAARA